MAAPKTVLTYPLNGTTVTFQVPFEYLARRFVQVTLIGATRRILILNTDYRFTTANSITTIRAWGPADGYESIEVRRFTSATDRIITFSDGSILRANDLNLADIQALHVAEEARDLTSDTIAINNDGDLDARGKKIVNVADATTPGGVITLRQVTAWNDSALNSKNAAAISAERAKNAADNALISQNLSAQSAVIADSAKASAQASALSTTNSKNAAATSSASAISAASRAEEAEISVAANAKIAFDEANRAKSEADRAQSIADGLGNLGPLGEAVQEINSTTKDVTWKGKIISKGDVLRLAPNLTSTELVNESVQAIIKHWNTSGVQVSFRVHDNGNAYVQDSLVMTQGNVNNYVNVTGAINSQVPPMINNRLNSPTTSWVVLGTFPSTPGATLVINTTTDLRGRLIFVLVNSMNRWLPIQLPPLSGVEVVVSAPITNITSIDHVAMRIDNNTNLTMTRPGTNNIITTVRMMTY